MNDLIPFNGGLFSFDKELTNGTVNYIAAQLVNAFTRKEVNLDYFKLDLNSGKLSFNTPWDYFHDFVQQTVMNSTDDNCMEEANYDIYVHLLFREKKATLVFENPTLLSSNNYGREEGYQILLQATEKEIKIKKGWL